MGMAENIEWRYQEYLRLKEGPDPYLALAYLAQIHHCLQFMDPVSYSYWDDVFSSLNLTEDFLMKGESGVVRDVRYIEKIMSIGEEWNDDEILLVLQQRIFIDLFIVIYEERFTRKIFIDLTNADRQILSGARMQKNRRSYEIAIRQMKKNWGLPIKSKWLDEAFYFA